MEDKGKEVIVDLGKFQLKEKMLKKIYYLSIFGTVIPLVLEYYNRGSEFIMEGSLEGMIYFIINLAVMIYIGKKFFEYGLNRIKKPIHIFLLFIGPMAFIEIEAETYLEESSSFIFFDQWYLYYQKGFSEFYENHNLNLSKEYFLKSIVVKNNETPSQFLVLKSQIFLTMIESLKGDKKKALKNFKKIYKNFPKTASHDLAMIHFGIGEIYNHYKEYENAQFYLQNCLEIILNQKLNDKELIFNCRYSMIENQFHTNQINEGKELLSTLFSFRPKKNKFNLRLIKLLDQLLQLKDYDFALDHYLELLERLRGKNEKDVIVGLFNIYNQLSHIYKETGNESKAEVYLDFRERMKEELNHLNNSQTKSKVQ